jgi:hypothetical protein
LAGAPVLGEAGRQTSSSPPPGWLEAVAGKTILREVIRIFTLVRQIKSATMKTTVTANGITRDCIRYQVLNPWLGGFLAARSVKAIGASLEIKNLNKSPTHS